MQYRKLGKTGWMVSEIGFGAWGIGGGWGARDDEEALRALERAFDLGVNFVDTAHGYGDGHSERLVAKAVKRCPNRIYVATKVPPKNFRWPASPDIPVTETFPVDWVIKCAEESLQRLETDCIDLLQLHAWADTYNEQLDWYEALVKLREQGKVRFFGVSINDRDPDSALRLVESGRVEAIQLIYNIFHQAPQEKLFPLAIKHDVGIIVRVPLEEGALSGKLRPGVTFHPDDWRKDYFTEDWLREIAERVDKLSFLIRDEIKTIAQAALKFCLSHPAVSTVIPGMRTVAHVEENVAVSDGILLKPEELERLKAHDWPHGVEYPWAAV